MYFIDCKVQSMLLHYMAFFSSRNAAITSTGSVFPVALRTSGCYYVYVSTYYSNLEIIVLSYVEHHKDIVGLFIPNSQNTLRVFIFIRKLGKFLDRGGVGH
jgi:hypothetical protein